MPPTVMTLDSEPEAIDSVDITSCVDVRYDQRADQLSLLIGFGHMAIPVAYRTKAMIELGRAQNEAAAT